MEEPVNLQEWEVLSDSDTNSIAFEEIIHSDYFALDSNHNNPHLHQSNEQSPEETENLVNSQTANENEASPMVDAAQIEMGSEGINKGGSFLADGSTMEVGSEGISGRETFQADDAKIDMGFEKTEPGVQKGDSFLVEDPKTEAGIEEMVSINQNNDELRVVANDERPQELVSHSSAGMSNSGSDSQKKLFIWWKLPFDMLRLCASRVRPLWSIPIAAAAIGILIVGRRLYKMKHKSKKIPLKITFEDKKAASRLLIHAARLNEFVVRRGPIIRPPLLPMGGVTPWPTIGQP